MRTNASGARTDVEQYTEHGGVLQYPVAFDGQKSLISSVTSNSPEAGITNLHPTSGLLTSGTLKGMTLVVSVLDIDANTLRIGRVVDNDTDDIWVLDDDSIAGAIYHHSAIQNGFVVYKQQDANEVLTSGSWDDVTTDGLTTDLIDTGVGSASTIGQWVSLPNGTWAEIISIPNANTVRVSGDRTEIVAASDPYVISKLPYTNLAYSTAGQWTAESFASSETTLTDTSATFNSYMVGWQIIVDMEFPMPLTITAVPSATTLKVAGDVRTLTDPGKFYILFAPPKVNPANGTLATIVTEGEDDDWFDLTGSYYLWAGYRYIPPMVGYYDNATGITKGAQAGNNKLGNYHCNNRVYSISHGRWLSPDQAASPFFNLFRYVNGRPVKATDPSGLDTWIEGTGAAAGMHQRLCVDTYDDNCAKTGKYCISFGAADTVGSSSDTSGSSSGDKKTDDKTPAGEDLSGWKEHAFDKGCWKIGEGVEGDGEVYVDITAEGTEVEKSRHVSTCAHDRNILARMKKMAGIGGGKKWTGEYRLFSRNCRRFVKQLQSLLDDVAKPEAERAAEEKQRELERAEKAEKERIEEEDRKKWENLPEDVKKKAIEDINKRTGGPDGSGK